MGSSLPLPIDVGQAPIPPLITQVDPRDLKPHPSNCSIYGSDDDVTELVEMIRASNWIKPLVITPMDVIVSGHRRWKVALELGLESVPVEVKEFSDPTAELEALLLENASRVKTTEQKVREALAWREIETFRAKLRQKVNLKIGNHTPVQENFPERERGQARDQIAHRVGLGSGRTYEKAAAVVREIDALLLDTPQIAMAFRKVLNEHSVDAAHRLLKKPDPQRQLILSLIATGEAKSTKQAEKMLNQTNNLTEFNNPYSATLSGFSVGDWIEVSELAENFETYLGLKGQVEQVWSKEQQVSVNFSDGPSKIKFYPHELTMVAKAPPSSPFHVGDIAIVDIDRFEAASAQHKKWNGFWGKVTQIGEMGSLTVDVGSESLQLFPRDLKQIDAPSNELRQVVERVLRLRCLKLDEIEQGMLDIIQRREWFTSKQLVHLENIEKLYPLADFYETEKLMVVQY